MKKLTSIVAGVILSFMSGCSPLSKLLHNPSPNPKLKPILPEIKIPYDEIEQRAKIVADSLEKNFPEGVVVKLKGYNKENDRYVVIKASKNEERILNLTLYKFTETEIEKVAEKIEAYLLQDYRDKTRIFYHKDAAEILAESEYYAMAVFNDAGINGIRRLEPEDFLMTQGIEEITLRGGKVISEGKPDKDDESDRRLIKSNFLYIDYLRALTSPS